MVDKSLVVGDEFCCKKQNTLAIAKRIAAENPGMTLYEYLELNKKDNLKLI